MNVRTILITAILLPFVLFGQPKLPRTFPSFHQKGKRRWRLSVAAIGAGGHNGQQRPSRDSNTAMPKSKKV